MLAVLVWAVLLPVVGLVDLGVAHYGTPDIQTTWNGLWHPHWSWSAWLVGLLVLLLIATFEGSYRLAKSKDEELAAIREQLSEIEETKPRIKLKEPGAVYVELANQNFRDEVGRIILQRTVPFLKVNFFNDPKTSSPSGNAKGVRAYIDYHRTKDNAHLLSIDGRWAQSDQPSILPEPASKAHLLAADFGSGELKSLDIAFRDPETGEYFAWNNDNYNYGLQFFRYPKHVLQGDRFRVTVRLRGDWIDNQLSFIFKAENGSFTIEQDSCDFR